jgi:hypothetical protein
MFLSFEQVAATASVKTVSALTVPAGAAHVEIQATVQNVSYTMDDSTDPTQTAGMFLLTTHGPKLFHAEDVRRIRFVRAAGSDGALNLHYYN